MYFCKAQGLCRNCGQKVTFFAAVELGERMDRARAVCELCAELNLFGGRSSPLLWSPLMLRPPKIGVMGEAFADGQEAKAGADRNGPLVQCLVESMWRDFGCKLRGHGRHMDPEIGARLIRGLDACGQAGRRADVEAQAARTVENIFFELARPSRGLWAYEDLLRFRALAAGFAAIFAAPVPVRGSEGKLARPLGPAPSDEKVRLP